MTNYKIEHLPFRADAVSVWGQVDDQSDNWPVVYTISSENDIYVGETVNAATRLLQHLHSPSKKHLERVQIIINDKFNKSVCLDLEAHLIKYFAADGKHRVLNANFGIQDSDYFNRDQYRKSFNELFEMLVSQGVLSRSIPEIVNSNLFKFSPFKSLNSEQAVSVSAVLEQLLEGLKSNASNQIVIQGDPGTGKTVVAIYLIKLMVDIARSAGDELIGEESIFYDFFTPESRLLLQNLRVGLVVPQQSLRKTLQTVFGQTPGLARDMVMTPFDVGKSKDHFDLLIVDEAHRLVQRANQSSAMLNKKFKETNLELFGNDDVSHTQLDWIELKSKSQILLLDTAQSVKPADLPIETTKGLITKAKQTGSLFQLTSQMRVAGGNDYLEFVKQLFSDNPKSAPSFGSYDLRFYGDFASMQADIKAMDQQHGLSRLLAGFAWPWTTKTDKSAFDIELEGIQLRWNQTAVDWVNSPGSVFEVGSIHTIQGYDLNYAGVIIGSDLGYDPKAERLVFNRENYFDTKGKENNPKLGISYTDEDLLQFVINIYKVLMTRGIKGTFVYVVDEGLRDFMSSFMCPMLGVDKR
jgi:DUF2075 family protein